MTGTVLGTGKWNDDYVRPGSCTPRVYIVQLKTDSINYSCVIIGVGTHEVYERVSLCL